MTMIRGNIKFIVLALLFLVISLSVIVMAFSVGCQTEHLIAELNKRADYLGARVDIESSDYANLHKVLDVLSFSEINPPALPVRIKKL